MNSYLSKQSAFIFDLDGCIYSGNTVYPAAKELLRILRLSGKQVLFLSNNSRHASETIREKIATMGLPVEDMSILVATELVGQYLLDKYGIMRLQTVGSVELEECLKRSGHQVISFGFPQECDALVFGLDTAFSYEKLYECSRQLSLGGKLVFFAGEIEEQNSVLVFQHEMIKVHIPDYQAKIIKVKDCINRKVILGVRPENIQIYTQPQGDTIAAGEIELIENLGSEMYLYIGGVDKKHVIARVGQAATFGRGDKVYLAISREAVQLFSQSTEENLLH